ncbi:hypothetical protein M5K25_020452 [Dendrobium thyrsiflorum]|uniref:Uncharacterized protein n=1 Tax=Dendrobium thyrsiflorum TaxID=117978 RepID=A0ABD0UAP8_DENTH
MKTNREKDARSRAGNSDIRRNQLCFAASASNKPNSPIIPARPTRTAQPTAEMTQERSARNLGSTSIRGRGGGERFAGAGGTPGRCGDEGTSMPSEGEATILLFHAVSIAAGEEGKEHASLLKGVRAEVDGLEVGVFHPSSPLR